MHNVLRRGFSACILGLALCAGLTAQTATGGVFSYGTAAQLPSACSPGQGYAALDTGAISFCAGGGWVSGPSSYIFPVGADPTGAADSASAIAAAVAEGCGKTVYLPHPSIYYRITSPVVIAGACNVTVKGDGWGPAGNGTEIYNAGTGNHFTVGTGATLTADVRIEDLLLVGTSSSAHGIEIDNVHNMTVSNVRISYVGGDAIHLHNAYADFIDDNYLNNNAGNGIWMDYYNDHVRIKGNRIYANRGDGIHADGGPGGSSQVIVQWNDIEGNANGLTFRQSGGATEGWIIGPGNYWEKQVGANMILGQTDIAGTVDNFQISGNHFNPDGCAPSGCVEANGGVKFLGALGNVVRAAVIGNQFDHSCWTVDSTVPIGQITSMANLWNNSTCSPPAGPLFRFNLNDPSRAQMSGATPGLDFIRAGFKSELRTGTSPLYPTIYEEGVNLSSVSATTGNLDNTAQGGVIVQMGIPSGYTEPYYAVFLATPGANPRPLVPALTSDYTGRVRIANGLILTNKASGPDDAAIQGSGTGLFMKLLASGWTTPLRAGWLLGSWSETVNMLPSQAAGGALFGALDDSGHPGSWWNVSNTGLAFYHLPAGSEANTPLTAPEFAFSSGVMATAGVPYSYLAALAGGGAVGPGSRAWCTDCMVATPCSGGGAGAWAFGLNSTTWACTRFGTVATGPNAYVQSSDPGCASVGTFWFNTAGANTVMNVCLNVSGALRWVAK